jgi:hypothetical protein
MKPVNASARLIRAIDDILTKHPEGIREYDLMAALDTDYPHLYPKPDLSDRLLLFQHHFYLKHSLYVLQKQLSDEGTWYLDIDTILITKRIANTEDKQNITIHDSVSEYYLDLSNLNKETPESIDTLINGFWEAMATLQYQPEAFKTLGLTGNEPPNEQKKTYKQLVQAHHPDKGGDEKNFRRIQQAWEAIKPQKN